MRAAKGCEMRWLPRNRWAAAGCWLHGRIISQIRYLQKAYCVHPAGDGSLNLREFTVIDAPDTQGILPGFLIPVSDLLVELEN